MFEYSLGLELARRECWRWYALPKREVEEAGNKPEAAPKVGPSLSENGCGGRLDEARLGAISCSLHKPKITDSVTTS